MTRSPPISELEFLKITANHRDFARKLALLGVTADHFGEYAQHMCKVWFKLAEAHLHEARELLKVRCPRATISRAYYAAYNASKSARYIAQGSVSLKGDDHGKASSELPGDFPDSATWAARITKLYENRLRADYDNWRRTRYEFSLTPAEAVADARAFLRQVRTYLRTTHGLNV